MQPKPSGCRTSRLTWARRSAPCRRGASLAVGGATALDAAFFRSRGILPAPSKFPLNASLSVQLEWFESRLKPSLCRTPTQGAYTYNVAVERNNNNSITRATGRK